MNGKDSSNQGDDSLTRVKGKPPVIQPKPKPAGKRLQVQAASGGSPIKLPPSKYRTSVNGKNDYDNDDKVEHPGDIELNPDSLAQFGKIDLDAVKRYQMLDTAAQRQKAYLSHGKGLQSRRLPSHLASKVGDDYYEKRKSYDPKLLLDSTVHSTGERDRSRTTIGDVFPSPNKGTLTGEDREKEIRAKVGVPQGTALAGLASIFRNRPSKKLTRSASSSSRDFAPPQVKAKPSKKSSDTSSPDLSRLRPDSSSSPGSRSRSSFKLFKKKKSRSSRDNSTADDVSRGSFEDLRSETSSLSSISRISIREEDAFEGNFPQKEAHSPFKEMTSPLKESPLIPHVLQSENSGSVSPKPTTTSTPSHASKSNTSLTVTSPTRKDRADSLFKDVSDLFGDEKDLFDSAELNSLLAKTKTEFGSKKETEKELKEEEKKKPLPVKLTTETKPPLPSQELPTKECPSKPMRKNRSRVLNTSLYDQAAETAIKSTKERKSDREKERELEKKKEEEKRKPKISLFEELEEEEDLFGEKKVKKSEPEKTVISKDDLFDELEKPVNPVSTTKPKVSSDSKTSERKTEVKSTETKGASLFDEELEAEESKKKDKEDAVKALFGDDSDKFAGKLSSTRKKSQEEATKGASELSFVEKSKLEIESEERKKTQNKTATKTNVFEDPLDSKKEPMNPKPPVTKKPSLPSPAHGWSPVTSPTRVKPPVISVKPKRLSTSGDGEQEVKKLSWKKELEDKSKDTAESKEADRMREKEEQKLKEEKLKQKEQKRKEEEEKAEKKIIEEEKLELEKEHKRKEEERIKEEEKKKRIEDEAKKAEEKNKKKLEEEKKRKEQEKKLEEEEKQKKLEEEKKEEEKKLEAEKKKKIEEEKQKGEDKQQPDKQTTPEMKRKDAEKKTATANEKPIPEWKRKAEERKLQREKEERESMAILEERRKKREEQKAAATTTTTTDKTSTTKSPEKSPIAKPKSKSNSITVTLSTSSNKPTEDTKEKSPVSPTIDPSLPKWKQDLIARKKSAGNGPVSPRRSTVSVAVEKKEDDLPAWKKNLLAKKKVNAESGGVGSQSGSTASPRSGRRATNQPVPEFMKEFQNKKKA